MAACGRNFTVVVTESGDVFALGKAGELAHNTFEHQLLPAGVAGSKVLVRIVMVAAGLAHSASVTVEGTLLTWGDGTRGQLGYGDLQNRLRPTLLGKELFGGKPAVMVACGNFHTLVLTAGGLWTCGFGQNGRLGHGDEADKLVLTQVVAQRFDGNAQIVMVAAGGMHSMAVGSEGGVWTWGYGVCLGHNDMQDRHVPTLLAGAAFDRGQAVMVATGAAHSLLLTSEGGLWAWGDNGSGQLGTAGPDQFKLAPARVREGDVFWGSPVRMAACGDKHSLIVTEAGILWSFGQGAYGALGHHDINERREPTQVESQHFDDAKIVSAAGGASHSAAVSEHGTLYMWGMGAGGDASPMGLDNMQHKLVPTCVAPHLLRGARVGRCHRALPLHALAFAMGTHPRLGSASPKAAPAAAARCGRSRKSRRLQGDAPAPTADTRMGCAYVTMPGELVQRVVEACASWPEGRAGELEGVVRLLGGMMKDKVSP